MVTDNHLEELYAAAKAAVALSKTARRNKKALTGSGYYASRFHEAVVALTRAERACTQALAAVDGSVRLRVTEAVRRIGDSATDVGAKEEAARELRLLLEAEVKPAQRQSGEPMIPASEPVLAKSVLRNAPQYLQRLLLQANGCYLQGWYDASAVMVRKLLESLIIELYERHGKADEIKQNGEYLMLSGLVTKLLNQNYWTLAREAKRGLPELKNLGDRSAHARHYLATRDDVDRVRSALRMTADNVVHHAGMDK